jgi:hypothetical protein
MLSAPYSQCVTCCCVVCRYDVDSVAAVVADFTADLDRSLDALRVSGSLHYLLAFVRDVANTMNRAGPRGPLAGFKLESLARLQVRASPPGAPLGGGASVSRGSAASCDRRHQPWHWLQMREVHSSLEFPGEDGRPVHFVDLPCLLTPVSMMRENNS